jgi:predicted nucleotidyltransferase
MADAPGVGDTTPSAALQALARELADAYLAATGPRAILLTGSAALGEADAYSDLDLILYYDRLPSEDAIAAARRAVGAEKPDVLAPPTETSYPETFGRAGVQCQLGHETIAGWEAEMRTVLVDLDVETPVQKAIAGLFEGVALHGEELVERWRREARYPDALARAMVERYWRFFPLWHVQERLLARDAVLWCRQALVESAFNLLAVLAGLNRLWFTSFQFKRLHAFTAAMTHAPHDLADRLDALFALDARAAIAELESLVGETQALLREHMRDVDATLRIPPRSREAPWR